MTCQISSYCSVSINSLTYVIPSYSYGISYNEQKQVLFMGNTSIKTLERTNYWTDYPVVFIECMNYNNIKSIIKNYQDIQHLSISELIPFMAKYTDISFILTHSSTNIHSNNINNIYDNIKNTHKLNNVYLWID